MSSTHFCKPGRNAEIPTGLAALAADGAAKPPYWDRTRTMTYGTGETTHTNVMLVLSAGDPASWSPAA